jgi:cellulose synthase/poly-beta-1,6-N-acetylglucosamine synthase-like glycosyltransferase
MTKPFQIIVPVFNEEDTLETVLSHAKEAGYLKYMVFVDDASTDSSPQILQKWASTENIKAIRLEVNRKKEGAIRAAMESLALEGDTAPYTVLLDADSLIALSGTNESVSSQLNAAIAHMQDNALGGVAFRIDAISAASHNVFSQCAFADYSIIQFDNWLVGHQFQLWVINGPGGLFETRQLLQILRSIVPDFETGDLLITVELMKQRRPIAFYPAISILTFVPTSLRAYFNQRRRWERGTTKVLWRERAFYLGLFRRPSLLALSTLVHLSIYFCIFAALIMLASMSVSFADFCRTALISSGAWFSVGLLKGVWLKATRPHFPYFRFCICAAVNGVLWIFVTTPARITGCCEAIYQLVGPIPKNAAIAQWRFDEPRWLRRDYQR